MADGIKAIVDKANKTCIGGRNVEFVGVKDNNADETTDLALAKTLVETDKVIAVIVGTAQ